MFPSLTRSPNLLPRQFGMPSESLAPYSFAFQPYLEANLMKNVFDNNAYAEHQALQLHANAQAAQNAELKSQPKKKKKLNNGEEEKIEDNSKAKKSKEKE